MRTIGFYLTLLIGIPVVLAIFAMQALLFVSPAIFLLFILRVYVDSKVENEHIKAKINNALNLTVGSIAVVFLWSAFKQQTYGSRIFHTYSSALYDSFTGAPAALFLGGAFCIIFWQFMTD